MNELFAQLRAAADAPTPNLPEVRRLLAEVDETTPADGPRARTMVDGLLISHGLPPLEENSAGGSSFLSPRMVLMGLIGGGAGVSIGNVSFKDIPKPPLPEVNNPWLVMLIVAAVGGVVGFGYAFYQNGTLVMPVVVRGGGQLRVRTFGFLRNVALAAVVAVLTVWVAFPSTTVAGVEGEDKPPPPPLLTWNLLAAAAAAGVVGSRMASGQEDTRALWKALSASVDTASKPGLGVRVEKARTPLEAATLAGTPPPGFTPPREANTAAGEAESKLLALFDRKLLKDMTGNLPKPVGPDGIGLPLAALESFQPLRPGLKSLLESYTIPAVAADSPDQFAASVERRGIDVATLRDTLDRLHAVASEAMRLLKDVPPSWTLVVK